MNPKCIRKYFWNALNFLLHFSGERKTRNELLWRCQKTKIQSQKVKFKPTKLCGRKREWFYDSFWTKNRFICITTWIIYCYWSRIFDFEARWRAPQALENSDTLQLDWPSGYFTGISTFFSLEKNEMCQSLCNPRTRC